MKSLNQLIDEYTYRLQLGEIQTAYRGILEFIGKLRATLLFVQTLQIRGCN